LRLGYSHFACQHPDTFFRAFHFRIISDRRLINSNMDTVNCKFSAIFLIAETDLQSDLLENLKNDCSILNAGLQFFPRFKNAFFPGPSFIRQKAFAFCKPDAEQTLAGVEAPARKVEQMIVFKMPGRQDFRMENIQAAAKTVEVVNLYFDLGFSAQLFLCRRCTDDRMFL